MTEPCPSDDVLALHVEGALTPAEHAEVASHVQACTACERLVRLLVAARTRSQSCRSSEVFPATTWRWEAGHRIGRHVLRGPLGRGAMGEVYEALDTKLRRIVAIKVARPGTSGEVGSARVVREGQTLARLEHPHVVRVFDAGWHDGAAYLVLEAAPGSSLRRWLLARPRSVRVVLELFRGVARGCAAVHAVGLVHRDIKPDNILVGDEGQGILGDFGLASPASGHSGGTPGYIAPEVERGQEATAASDQFAFCVTLEEALKTCSKGTVPRGVRAAIRRGKSADPAARFESMEALLGMLRPRASPWRLLPAVAAPIAVAAVFATSAGPDGPRDVSDPGTHQTPDDPNVTEAQERLALATAAREDGRTEDAAVLASEATTLAHATGRPGPIAASLCESGKVSAARGLNDRAAEQLESAHWMAMRAETYDVAADSAVELVDILSSARHFDDAQRWRNSASAALDRLPADDLAQRVQLAIVTSLLHQRMQAYADAVTAAERARTLATQLDPAQPSLLVAADMRIGGAMLAAGDAEGSRTALESALALQLELHGEQHLTTGKVLYSLAVLHANNLPEPDEAVRLFRRALAIVDAPGSRPSLVAAKANENLAHTLLALQRHREARHPVERAAALFGALFDEDHPQRLGLYTIRANLAQAEGQPDEARKWAEEGMLMANRSLGGRDPYTGSMTATAGELAFSQGDYAIAAQRFATALSIYEFAAGPTHPMLGMFLRRLGDTHVKMDEPARATAHYERALELDIPADTRAWVLVGLATIADDPNDVARYAARARAAHASVEPAIAELLDGPSP